MIVSALAFSVEHKRIHLRAFVVMPDHWHALFALRDKWALPRFMHDLMSFIGAKPLHFCSFITHLGRMVTMTLA